MTLTIVDSGNYREDTNPDISGKISIWKLPKIMWVAVAIFAINLLVGTGVFVTSDTNLNGERRVYSTSGRPSPFAETVDTSRHKVRLAAKLRPVSFVSAPAEDPAFLLTPQPVAYSPDRGYEVPGVINKTDKLVLIN